MTILEAAQSLGLRYANKPWFISVLVEGKELVVEVTELPQVDLFVQYNFHPVAYRLRPKEPPFSGVVTVTSQSRAKRRGKLTRVK